MHLKYLSLTIILLMISLSVMAQIDTAFHSNVTPTLNIPSLDGKIEIDGEFGEPAWKTAARASNFTEYNPGDNCRPKVNTEVLVGYDAENFYLGFIAHDDPALVRASLRDRDEIYQEDYVGIILDTYGDASWGYEIFVNPLGIQGDLRVGLNGMEDISLDLIFHSRGKVTDSGFQVEVAIPFNSLRFPNKPEQTWKANFWRNSPRDSRYQISWTYTDRNNPCWLCQFGTLTGIKATRSGGNLEILPTLVSSQVSSLKAAAFPDSGLHNYDPEVEASLNLRYIPASNITFDLAYNPDFSQVESDPGQIDINTSFALFFDERRPFFQEGADLFSTTINAVYTRSINDPQIAGKMVAQLGRTRLGYIGARDEITPLIIPLEEKSGIVSNGGKSISNIARLKRGFGNDSFLGALLTTRHYDDGGSNVILSGDGSIRFRNNYSLNFQTLASSTVERDDTALTPGMSAEYFDGGAYTAAFDGEKYWGHLVEVSLVRDARTWNGSVTYNEKSPTFRADNGAEFRNDMRLFETWQGLSFRPHTSLIDQISTSIDIARVWNFRKERKDEWIRPELSVLFKRQTQVALSYLWSRETYRGIYFPGIRELGLEVVSNFSRPVSLSGGLEIGKRIARNVAPPILGKSLSFWLQGVFRPTSQLQMQSTISVARMKDPVSGEKIFDGYILRTRLSYQFTRELFLRLVVQYDDFDKALALEPLLSYKANPFTVFFIGSGYNYRDYEFPGKKLDLTTRQFFLKFQYLFRA